MRNKQSNKVFEGIRQRAFDIESDSIRVIDDEQRVVELSFSSETPIQRFGATEILSHKSGAVMLDRLNTTGCLLFNHDQDRVIGKIVSAKVEKERGIACVQFDTDTDSDVIYQKVKGGTLRGVSVGYCIHESTRTIIGKGDDIQVIYTATKWEPIEISIVSIPADTSVGVGRSMSEGTASVLKMLDNKIKINQNTIKSRRHAK